MSTIVNSRGNMQTSGCTCQTCDTKLTCPQCTKVNAINNEWANIKNEMKELRKHVTCCSLAILGTLVASIAILLATPLFYNQLSFTNTHLSRNDCFNATGKGLEMGVIGERANVALQNVKQCGNGYRAQTDSVVCELISETTCKKLDCCVKEKPGNQYEISYQPTSRGRHQLHIKVEGEHIKGSPFNVTVIKKLGTPITDKFTDKVKKPKSVAINQRGEIIVAEKNGSCISIFSPTGEKLQQLDSGQGQLIEPYGVATDDGGNIFVTDHNHRIQKFSSEYKFNKSIGELGSNPLQFNHPLYVAISPVTKKIAVADWHNRRVQILNPDLTFHSSIGSQGSGNGQFNRPYGVAFDNAGNMYVTDTSNNCIQVFNPEGKFLRQFGRLGQGDGELSYPTGIYVDSDDTVYVADGNNYRVSIFTCEGKFLTSFGSYGSGPGQFSSPRGITMDKNGIIYVSDTSNNNIQIF